MKSYDVISVGAGPAGLTAALYALRAGRKVLLLENGAAGGTVAVTDKIENYPGVGTVDGYTLSQNMLEQVMALGAELVYAAVTEFDLVNKRLRLEGGDEVTAPAIVLAMGARAKKIGIPDEESFMGYGLSYCATCDGMLYRGKEVALFGSGTKAVSDAKYLAGVVKKVYLVSPRPQEAEPDERLETLYGWRVSAAFGRPIEAVELVSADGEKRRLAVSGLFGAVGFEPNTFGLSGLTTDEKGFIVTDEDMKTDLAGIYAAGDIRAKTFRQIVTACADGAIAGHFAAKKKQS